MSPHIIRWLPNRQMLGDEQIVLFIRRHWAVLVGKYLFMFMLAFIPFISYYLFDSVFHSFTISDTGRGLVILIASIYYLFVWLTCFTIFIDYYLDVWIVTTHRIIDTEQRGLFNHSVAEQTLDKVQDVQSSEKGVGATLFNFGDVLVETAGAQNLFEFKQVPAPTEISRTISQLAEKYRNSARAM